MPHPLPNPTRFRRQRARFAEPARRAAASPILVRAAQAHDVPSLLAMMRALAAYEGHLASLHTNEASLLRDGFSPAPRFAALIAEIDGEPAGYVTYTVGYSIWAGHSTLLVDDVYVAAEWRGQGVGRELMAGIGRACREGGHAFARWTVEPDNGPAIGFYENLGARVAAKGLCTWRPDPA